MARRGKVHSCGPSLRPVRVKVNESIEEVGQKCSIKWKRFERLFCQITSPICDVCENYARHNAEYCHFFVKRRDTRGCCNTKLNCDETILFYFLLRTTADRENLQ